MTIYHDVPWTCPACGFESTTSAYAPDLVDHPCSDACTDTLKAAAQVREALLLHWYRVTISLISAPHTRQDWTIRAKTADNAFQCAALKAAQRYGYQASDYVLLKVIHNVKAPKRPRD